MKQSSRFDLVSGHAQHLGCQLQLNEAASLSIPPPLSLQRPHPVLR